MQPNETHSDQLNLIRAVEVEARAEGRDNQQSDHDLQARIAYRAECSLFHYPWLLATGFYNLFRHSVAVHRYVYGPM